MCHEVNLIKSREFKRNKYSRLSEDLKPTFIGYQVFVESIEVSSLGLISDTAKFTLKTTGQSMPASLLNEITNSAISNSYNIYRKRNSDLTELWTSFEFNFSIIVILLTV